MKSKKKRNAASPLVVKSVPETPPFTHEEYVEMQAEAYYLALKRIEREREPINNENSIPNKSLFQKAKLVLKIIFFPRHINFKQEKPYISDDLLSLIVSLILNIIGYGLRFVSFLLFLLGVYYIVKAIPNILDIEMKIVIAALSYIISSFSFAFILSLVGSAFNLSSKEIENEKDNNRLYAYSSSIMASLALITSIIAVLLSLK